VPKCDGEPLATNHRKATIPERTKARVDRIGQTEGVDPLSDDLVNDAELALAVTSTRCATGTSGSAADTVLFTDITGSTSRAAELGDERWSGLLRRHHDLVRRQLERFRGREVKTMGDGFLATFDGPARAIACACAIRDAVGQLGLGVRAGLHTGELDITDSDVAGIAVHIGQRVSSLAQPGEVLVSRTVVDLVVGSGIQFSDRGEYDLKGVPGTWRLFAVDG
jgi:class 3 adenylate cyclase